MKKYIRKIINYIIDMSRKRKIFKHARICGKDCDGDIIRYNDTIYYIHILNNMLRRVEEDKYDR